MFHSECIWCIRNILAMILFIFVTYCSMLQRYFIIHSSEVYKRELHVLPYTTDDHRWERLKNEQHNVNLTLHALPSAFFLHSIEKMSPFKKLRISEVQQKYGNYTQSSKRLLPSGEEHIQLFRWEDFEHVLYLYYKKSDVFGKCTAFCMSSCCYNMIDTSEVCLIKPFPLNTYCFQ